MEIALAQAERFYDNYAYQKTSIYMMVGIVITIFPADRFEPNQVRCPSPIVFGRRPCSRKGNRFATGQAILALPLTV